MRDNSATMMENRLRGFKWFGNVLSSCIREKGTGSIPAESIEVEGQGVFPGLSLEVKS